MYLSMRENVTVCDCVIYYALILHGLYSYIHTYMYVYLHFYTK